MLLALISLNVTNFRCLASVEAVFSAPVSLVVGPNAAGKTSLLEAIAYCGLGRSFRGATVDKLIRRGESEFVVSALVSREGREFRIGVRNGRSGLEVSVGGYGGGGAAALAGALPVQVIDPEVHDLVAGGPEQRRRYLDWTVFHVEQGFLDAWRRYRRVLRQRNACLKSGGADRDLVAWDRELIEHAETVTAMREGTFELLKPVLVEVAERLLGSEVGFEFHRGWKVDLSLEAALTESRERDRRQQSTQVGPQRADIRLVYDDRVARKMVSRGQQKLLACAMVLGATYLYQEVAGEPLLILLDDPAAELDDTSLGRLVAELEDLGSQIIATSLDPHRPTFSSPPQRFHVEHGHLSPAGDPE